MNKDERFNRYKKMRTKSYLNFSDLNIGLEQAVTFRAIIDLVELCRLGLKEVKDKDKGNCYNINEIMEYFNQTTHLKNIFNSTIRLCRLEFGNDKVNRVLKREVNIYES